MKEMADIAKTLYFREGSYTFACAKHNILTYTHDAEQYYSDWSEDGGVLVVEYHPEVPEESGRYYVLSLVRVGSNGCVESVNLGESRRCASENRDKNMW